MCDICQRDPCVRRCPNFRPKYTFQCANCADWIEDDSEDSVVDSSGRHFCDHSCAQEFYGIRYVEWEDLIANGNDEC